MPSRQINLQEDTNIRVLRLLQDNPNISQRQLADALGHRGQGGADRAVFEAQDGGV